MSDLSERIAKLSPEKRALLEQRMRSERTASGTRENDIAVIGIGCRFPGGVDSPDSYWKLLVEGIDAICTVPAARWDVAG